MGKVGMVLSNPGIELIVKFGPNEILSQKIKGLHAFKLQSSDDLTCDMKLRNVNLRTAGNISLNSLTPHELALSYFFISTMDTSMI